MLFFIEAGSTSFVNFTSFKPRSAPPNRTSSNFKERNYNLILNLLLSIKKLILIHILKVFQWIFSIKIEISIRILLVWWEAHRYRHHRQILKTLMVHIHENNLINKDHHLIITTITEGLVLIQLKIKCLSRFLMYLSYQIQV